MSLKEIKWETEKCTRCGGRGMTGWVGSWEYCWKCKGAGVQLTIKGFKLKHYYEKNLPDLNILEKDFKDDDIVMHRTYPPIYALAISEYYTSKTRYIDYDLDLDSYRIIPTKKQMKDAMKKSINKVEFRY